MGLLEKIFGNNQKDYNSNLIDWIHLKNHEQLDDIILRSDIKTQVIFKHSTGCGISRGVLNRFEKGTDTNNIDFYYLDLLNFRALSNEIANRFNIVHQSPQLIVIKNGKSVLHNSHYDILEIKF